MSFEAVSPFELRENFFDAIGRQWMLVTAAKPNGSVNSMTAAWGGIGFIWQEPVAYVFIRPQRCTKTFVEASPTLSLSFFTSEYRDALNFMGGVSGFNDADKVVHSGLTLAFRDVSVTGGQPERAEQSEPTERTEPTPYFEEARLVLLCERLYQQDMLEECFLDKAQVKAWYGQVDGELDFHTLYIVRVAEALVRK
jgi:flavin reductase (DIM6/NTAB) family NADH-FMN oxidoreductase RutF